MTQGTQKSDIADQHDRYPRLSVTLSHLLAIIVLLGLGQSVTAGNLGWAGGLFAAVILYYLGLYGGEDGLPWIDRFFRTDLSRPTFDFVKRFSVLRFVFALVFNVMLGMGTCATIIVLGSLGMSTNVNLVRVAFICSSVCIYGIFVGGEALLLSPLPKRAILLLASLLSALLLSWYGAFMFLHIYGWDHVYRTFHLDGWEDL